MAAFSVQVKAAQVKLMAQCIKHALHRLGQLRMGES